MARLVRLAKLTVALTPERVEGVQPHLEAQSQADGGAGLGTAWGEQKALAMLGEVGFSRVEVLRLADDPLNNYYVTRKA